MDLKEFTANLLKQEFGQYLVDLRFSGPYEDEDLNVDVILKEKPVDFKDRDIRVFQKLLDTDLDILIDYELLDDRLNVNVNPSDILDLALSHKEGH